MRPKLLLVSGSLRERSTNSAVLRTTERLAHSSWMPVLYRGMGDLPPFNPDCDALPLPPAVADLRAQIQEADVVLFSVPEYAGDLPGAFKNVLDWCIGDPSSRSLSEKPVAWLNASTRGAVHAHESLRRVLGYANATLVEGACLSTPATESLIGDDGEIADPEIKQSIVLALSVLSASVSPLPTPCSLQSAQQ
jgi:chromate reductase